MLTSLTFFQTLRFPFLIFSLLELCVSSRNSRNSAIIDGFKFTVNRTYLTCNGCFSISILPCFGNKVADSSCCIFSSFRAESVRRRRLCLQLLKGIEVLARIVLPCFAPSLFHLVSGPVLRSCLPSCRTQRVFIWLSEKAYQNVSIILQSFFNVTLRSKNLNWLLSTLLTIIVLSNLVLELNNALVGYVPFCRWTKKYFCWRPCRLCRNDLFSQRLHFALENETYTTFCSYARFLGYRRFVGWASGT